MSVSRLPNRVDLLVGAGFTFLTLLNIEWCFMKNKQKGVRHLVSRVNLICRSYFRLLCVADVIIEQMCEG